MFFQASVPKLQAVGQVCTFLRWQRGFKIPSSAAFGKIGDAYVKAIQRFAEEEKIPVIRFKKGQDKEEIARPYIEAAAREGKDRVVLIGIAQEKASGMEIVAPQRSREQGAPPHGLGPRDGFCEPFLFLCLGLGLGRSLLEDERICSFSDLDLAQWTRVGQAAVGEGRDRIRGLGQWIPVLR
jgi:hypothetical protein